MTMVCRTLLWCRPSEVSPDTPLPLEHWTYFSTADWLRLWLLFPWHRVPSLNIHRALIELFSFHYCCTTCRLSHQLFPRHRNIVLSSCPKAHKLCRQDSKLCPLTNKSLRRSASPSTNTTVPWTPTSNNFVAFQVLALESQLLSGRGSGIGVGDLHTVVRRFRGVCQSASSSSYPIF